MKRFFFLLSIVLILTSCSDRRIYTLTGKFSTSEMNGKMVYLMAPDYESLQLVALDSTLVEDGRFLFEGMALDTPQVQFIDWGNYTAFVAEQGKIDLEINPPYDYRLKGTPLNNELQQFSDEQARMIEESQKIYGAMEALLKDRQPTEAEITQFENEKKTFMESFHNKLYEMIRPQIQTPFGMHLFESNSYYLSPEHIIQLVEAAKPSYQSLSHIQEIKTRALAQETCSVGKPFVDIRGKNLEGKEIALSDYAGKGKVVLLDFWASWCGPCLQSLPQLMKTYEKYKNKGFVIVGVSLDDNLENWKQMTEKQQIPWAQFSNLKGWTDDAALAYGVQGIPATFLIDKEGIIVEQNPEEFYLEILLEKLLK